MCVLVLKNENWDEKQTKQTDKMEPGKTVLTES